MFIVRSTVSHSDICQRRVCFCDAVGMFAWVNGKQYSRKYAMQDNAWASFFNKKEIVRVYVCMDANG